MASTMIGVEIGAGRLKLAQMKNGMLERFAAADLPENIVRNGQVVSWSGLLDFMKETMKANGIKGRKTSLVLPSAATYLRRLSMPLMTENQLKVNLPYEFRDTITEEADKYLYDYAMVSPVDESGEKEGMELVGAAIPKELLTHYTELMRGCGLKLVKAMPEYQAIGAIVSRFGKTQGDIALLDMGWDTTDIVMFRDGNYEVTRSIEIGVGEVCRVIADTMHVDTHIAKSYIPTNYQGVLEEPDVQAVFSRIAIEIMRVINYYSYENPDNTLQTIYYCGGGAHIKQFLKEIEESVPLELLPLTDIDRTASWDELLESPAVFGCCLE